MSIKILWWLWLISCMAASAAAADLTITVPSDVPAGTYILTPQTTPPIPPNPGGDTPFAALHTYFISPTGSDNNNGASPATAWASPNHPVACGDVIVAASGAYNSRNFDSHSVGASVWGRPSNCPSTTGGIDGKGGVYTATLVCATFNGCTIDASTQYAMVVDRSNWAIEGFHATANQDGNGGCFSAQPTQGDNLAFIAFVNDIAAGCPLLGLGSGGQPPAHKNAVDEFAVVGSIAFDAARSASYCGSGLGDNVPINVNTLPGVHVYFSQNFSYGNINGPCSVNSVYKGAFTNMAANAKPGDAAIRVAAVSGWGVNWPIGAADGVNYANSSAAIPQPTLVSSINGTTIGLSNSVASPGLTLGQLLAIATSTDGNGLILDTWNLSPYTGKTAIENNVFWKNGAHGFEMFCAGGTCADGLNITVTQNTMYCDAQDYKRDGNVWELYDGEAFPGKWTFTITNNLAQACLKQPSNSKTTPPWNGTTGVGGAGTGQPVVAGGFGRTGLTVNGNYFFSVPGVACPIYANCDPGNNIAMYNGANYLAGNTFASPNFAAPDTLPSTAPDCHGFGNAVDCMNSKYGVAAAMKSGAAPTKGYQPPSATCQDDPLYPTWLKGIVYLAWTGSAVVQKHGLVTTPCGL